MEKLLEKLNKKGLTLGAAESCTGGMICEMVTGTPGASAVFLGGVVSYANEVKINVLGVSPETLSQKGAVCEDVAGMMAEAAKPGETLSIVLTVIVPDGETYRFVDVPFTVEPVQREARTGSAAFDEYSAEALLYVVDYQLIADGTVLTNKDYTYGEAEGGYGIPVRYDLPESVEHLVLRPVRYWSGECTDEEIVLR